MEIKVRGVKAVAVKKIDQEAKKRGMSRNEFLNAYLEKFAFIDMHTEERNLYKEAVEMNSRMLHAFRETQKDIVSRVENIDKVLVRMIQLDTEVEVKEGFD